MKDLITGYLRVIIYKTDVSMNVQRLNGIGRRKLNYEEHGALYSLPSEIRVNISRRRRRMRMQRCVGHVARTAISGRCISECW
jgi:hypothetical protein